VKVTVGILSFLNTAVQLGPVDQFTKLVQFADTDKLPLHQLQLLVIKNFFFLHAHTVGFVIGFFPAACLNEAELFIELGGVLAIAADDAEDQFG